MRAFQEPDLAQLFHLHSSNLPERTIDLSLDEDRAPARYRLYPAQPYRSLPGRDFAVPTPFGEVVKNRTSRRDFSGETLDLETFGRLLFLSYGVRGRRKIEGQWLHERNAPSAGGLFPLELYAATRSITGLEDGLYHYDPRRHAVSQILPRTVQDDLAAIVLSQDMVRRANAIIIITAIPYRTMWKYGQRGYRFVLMECGHVGQSLYLLGGALGLGAVSIGGFYDDALARLMRLERDEHPLYLVCLGRVPAATA